MAYWRAFTAKIVGKNRPAVFAASSTLVCNGSVCDVEATEPVRRADGRFEGFVSGSCLECAETAFLKEVIVETLGSSLQVEIFAPDAENMNECEHYIVCGGKIVLQKKPLLIAVYPFQSDERLASILSDWEDATGQKVSFEEIRKQDGCVYLEEEPFLEIPDPWNI